MKTLKAKAAQMQSNFAMRMVGVSPNMEAGDHLLEVLGVIIIAVILLMFFKDNIVNLFNNMISNTKTSVETLWSKNMG